MEKVADDFREHNAHGERRTDEHNAAGVREDENQQFGGGDSQRAEDADSDRVSQLEGELKILKQKEYERLTAENERLKREEGANGLFTNGVVQRMKQGIEELKNNFEMEKLRAENVLLKAERQFHVEVQNIRGEKRRFEKLYETTQQEKEEIERKFYQLLEQNCRKQTERETLLKLHRLDLTQMSRGDFMLLGSHMILEDTCCSRYAKWFNTLHDIRFSGSERVILSKEFLVLRFFLSHKQLTNLEIDLSKFVANADEWETPDLKCVKLLHPSIHSLSQDMNYRGGSRWGCDQILSGCWFEKYTGFTFHITYTIFLMKKNPVNVVGT